LEAILLAFGALVIGALIGALVIGLYVVDAYEAAVVFRFGKLAGRREAGLHLRIPLVDRVEKLDLRLQALTLEEQEVITKDSVTAKLVAVVYFLVQDPIAASTKVDGYYDAVRLKAETVLRTTIGKHTLDELLQSLDKMDEALKVALDHLTEDWGIVVKTVEIKDIQLPVEMQRAMAQEAEAERERRAKVIAAAGEMQAANDLAQAAAMLESHPGGLQLRSLQTMREMASENTTIVLFPVELLAGVKR
jgi:regulator of protease activity HflC (stomatin/prohibitin superfamily)